MYLQFFFFLHKEIYYPGKYSSALSRGHVNSRGKHNYYFIQVVINIKFEMEK